MFYSALIPSVIVCLGVAMAAVAQTCDVAQPAAGTIEAVADLANTVNALEKRVATIERQLADRKEQEQLGRGFLPIDPVVANIDEGRLNRYITVFIVLSIDDGQKQSALNALTEIKPKIKDWVIGFLSSKTLYELRSPQNLREEIQAGINSQLKSAGYPEFAKAVLFDEIKIQ